MTFGSAGDHHERSSHWEVTTTVSAESLEGAIRRAGSPVELLRNASFSPFSFPIAPEFSNWRTEQRAWRESCALFDQSHHMVEVFVEGPGALQLFSDLGVNTFANFRPGIAKQFVSVGHDGNMIGDGILFYLGPERLELVGAQPALVDWVHYNWETGAYDARLERHENSAERIGPPVFYRYELQGPTAPQIMDAVCGSSLPDLRFFHIADITIDGHAARALRHGIAGERGFEIFGPWEDGETILNVLLEAGAPFGIVRAGAKAYSTANLESGWIPRPVPAIFTSSKMLPFREWCSADRSGSLGGSLYSPEISDYYVTPFDLGYGRLVNFDHDFIGREALAETSTTERRGKVTLVWDPGDVTNAMGSILGDGEPAKYFDLPKARYALYQSDAVLAGGRRIGISMDCGYIHNDRAMVSLATIDLAYSEVGTEVTVLWGENPNSTKPQVEAHRQVEIRATVAPAPYGTFARERYRAAVASEAGEEPAGASAVPTGGPAAH
jgi:vanillate/3-O-methylgallate O-demethylase